MASNHLDAIIIPSTDPHQSEYVAPHWKLREYFSGFTGSAGTLVITKEIAALWTDSRYFLQFEEECKNSTVTLHKQSIPHAPEHVAWLCNLLPKKARIGIDFKQFSKSQIDYILNYASPKYITLENQEEYANEIWVDRPELPNTIIAIHPFEFSGETTHEKLKKVQQEIVQEEGTYYFFSSLDEIAWLFNIRARDIEFTPLVTAYALVGKEKTILFCNKNRVSETAIEAFLKINIHIQEYHEITEYLSEIPKDKTILTDASSLNFACFHAFAGHFKYLNSIAKALKAIKNTTEINGAKACMIKDGVALTKFFIWLEKKLKTTTISEYEIGKKLASFRQQQAYYTGESFAAIVGYKGNGAIIHYTAPEEGSAMVCNDGILLIDSGGQYQNGTTDITRTIWLGGTPSSEIITAYTNVLKGYIALEELQFPKGTTGAQIDAFARMHLWKNGLNYPHGTGHGIGSFGMVHEPEQGFTTSATTARGTAPHLAQQLTTIEPGCYVANSFGIRTENVVLSKTVQQTDFGEFLRFEPITLCYIDTKLLDMESLLSSEIQWLNNYHNKVFEELAPQLSKEEREWLAEKCKSI